MDHDEVLRLIDLHLETEEDDSDPSEDEDWPLFTSEPL